MTTDKAKNDDRAKRAKDTYRVPGKSCGSCALAKDIRGRMYTKDCLLQKKEVSAFGICSEQEQRHD